MLGVRRRKKVCGCSCASACFFGSVQLVVHVCVCARCIIHGQSQDGPLFLPAVRPRSLYNDLPVAVCGHLCLCKSIGRGFPAMSIIMLAHIHQTFCFASIFMQCACRVVFVHRKCSLCACCQCRVVRIDDAYNLKSHAKACEYKFLYILSLQLCLCMLAVFSSCRCAYCVSVDVSFQFLRVSSLTTNICEIAATDRLVWGLLVCLQPS